MEDEADEERIRDELSEDCLGISKDLNPFMFANADSFAKLSRENTTVRAVEFYLFDGDAGNYELWDKVGQIVGNLMELHTLSIRFLPPFPESDDDDDSGDEAFVADWEILTRILRYIQHKFQLYLSPEGEEGEVVEEIQGLARAIHGHPMISGFISPVVFSFPNVGHLSSTLATLPSLENVTLGFREPQTEDQHDLVNLEAFTELLLKPALRFVEFEDFYFTDALCHATANALEVGSSLIDVSFQHGCSFTDGGRAIIANALKRNASVTSIKLLDDCDEPFCNSLAAVLLCNSTLREVTLKLPEDDCGRWLSSIFLSL
jgi:hypothetical protein